MYIYWYIQCIYTLVCKCLSEHGEITISASEHVNAEQVMLDVLTIALGNQDGWGGGWGVG